LVETWAPARLPASEDWSPAMAASASRTPCCATRAVTRTPRTTAAAVAASPVIIPVRVKPPAPATRGLAGGVVDAGMPGVIARHLREPPGGESTC